MRRLFAFGLAAFTGCVLSAGCTLILPFDDFKASDGGSLPSGNKKDSSTAELGDVSVAEPEIDSAPPEPPADAGKDVNYPDVSAYGGCYDAVEGDKICGFEFQDEGGYPGPPQDLVTCAGKVVANVEHCEKCVQVSGAPDHCQ